MCDAKHHKNQDILKIKIIRQAEESVEFPYAFKNSNISIFDGVWRHTKLPINFLKLGCFQIPEHYCFWNSETIGK